MIFYFSGTGNSLTIARQLAKFTTDTLLVDMAQPWQSSQTIEAETIGFVFPVYAWGLPLIVEDFIHKLPPFPPHVHYVYALLTCGDDMAYTDHILQKALSKNGWRLDACYSIQMRNTYVCLPGFNTDSDKVVQKKNREWQKQLPQIVQKILEHEKSTEADLKRGCIPWLKSYVLRPLFNRWLISDKHFSALETCIHCGLCAQQCPLHNISLDSQREPHWNGHCTHCLRCFHICPKHAINYGKFTRNKKQVKIIS